MKNLGIILFAFILFGCSNSEGESKDKKSEKKTENKEVSDNQEEVKEEKNEAPILHTYENFFNPSAKKSGASSIDGLSSDVASVKAPTYFKRGYDELIMKTYDKLKSDKITAIQIPESILSNSSSDVVIIEEGYEGKNSSFQKLFNSANEAGEKMAVNLYYQIDLGNGFKNYFAGIVSNLGEKSEQIRWEIIAIDDNDQIVSSLGKCDEFFVIGNEIYALWYYASDPDPTYEVWKQNAKGQFEMTSSSTKQPEILKEYLSKMEVKV